MSKAQQSLLSRAARRDGRPARKQAWVRLIEQHLLSNNFDAVARVAAATGAAQPDPDPQVELANVEDSPASCTPVS